MFNRLVVLEYFAKRYPLESASEEVTQGGAVSEDVVTQGGAVSEDVVTQGGAVSEAVSEEAVSEAVSEKAVSEAVSEGVLMEIIYENDKYILFITNLRKLVCLSKEKGNVLFSLDIQADNEKISLCKYPETNTSVFVRRTCADPAPTADKEISLIISMGVFKEKLSLQTFFNQTWLKNIRRILEKIKKSEALYLSKIEDDIKHFCLPVVAYLYFLISKNTDGIIIDNIGAIFFSALKKLNNDERMYSAILVNPSSGLKIEPVFKEFFPNYFVKIYYRLLFNKGFPQWVISIALKRKP
jgi:hypothetical protein